MAQAPERGVEIYQDQKGNQQARTTANYGGSGKSVATAVDETQRTARERIAQAAARAQKKTPMPKQQDGESPAAYSDRLRRWRAGEE